MRDGRRIKTGARFLFGAGLAVMLVACGRREGPLIGEVNGRVVSAGSSRALPGARVVIEWRGQVDAFADTGRMVLRRCQTVAKTDGSYSVGAWRAPGYVTGSVKARATAYLPGYSMNPPGSSVEQVGPEPQMLYLFAAESSPVPGDVTDCARQPEFD